ncbi:transporter substrate-binding domain-containing protein [Paramaledivibacter caminithermalis]|jgi:polar amino acid transport system substrate-binding protein|uniref:histidine kinase n=1 Tax=Paramaledivibacter caminithermalis (strain DSM 15212 / CIP 107654 / DViRD3) TaxID=1121301 RepID=A0A1M6RB17_PARC5|nr:transporter substrate-binding domain-containing protein [Paramaledivibacter caminithermalis]SHK29626.1 polar amino acid transport system substrate-binding protein [Paramaledivibacter caminithermalis DSM 15212]
MKRRFVVFFILIFILLVVYVNKYLELEYNVNILEYIQLSSDFTSKEKEILNKYQPLIYGGNINEPPLGIYYEENKQYVGFVVDLINALSIELGVTIASKPMVWNEALEALMEGETDLCDMTPSAKRAKSFAFSAPIYRLRGLIVVKDSNNKINDLYDLDGMTIGVQKGDYSIEFIASQGINADFVCTDNVYQALDLLYNNEVDAVVGDEPVIRYYLNELHYADDYRILEEPFYDDVCVIAVSKEKKELLRIIDKAIFNMKRKGTNRKIQMKWLGYTTFLRKNKSLEKLKLNLAMFLILVMIIGYLIYLWNRSLKLLVNSRTKELEIMKNELEITFNGMENFLIVLGTDLKVKNINSSFLKYLKKEKEKVLDSSFKDIQLLCDFEKQNNGLIHKLLSCPHEVNGFNPQKKYEIKSKGSLFQISIYPLERKEYEVVNILIMISDITNTRIQEQKLIHSNKMETIGQLAAGMAHELRNPLGVIRNSTFILYDEYEQKDELKTMALEAIDNSVDRASRIIENLLNFSRLTHDVKAWTNLKELIKEVASLYKKALDEQGITLNIFCEEDIVIYINSESLKHILMNLIKNAIDAMEGGGALEIYGSSYSQKIEIRVKDNGIGIEEEIIDRIFDPFYTTKAVGKGTGLGLYIAYSEVQKINGDIKVLSEKNKGATFVIDIPYGSEEIWEQN